MSSKIKIVINAYDKASRQINKAGQAIRGLSSDVDNAQKTFFSWQNVINVTAGMLTGLLAHDALGALQTAIKDSIDKFMSFQDSMADVAAKMGVPIQKTQELANLIMDLGEKYGVSAAEASQAAVAFAGAGYDTADAMKALEAAMQLAIVTGTDMADAGNLIVQMLATFGENADQASRYVDALVAADLASISTAQELGNALGYAGASAAALGMNVYDTLTAIVGITNAIGDANKAGRYLDALLRELMGVTDEWGIEIYDANGNMRDFGDIIGDVAKKMKGLSTEEKMAYLQTMGLDSQAARALLTLTRLGENTETAGDQAGDAASAFKDLKSQIEETGKASETTKTKLNTLSGELDRLRVKVENTQIEIGEDLAPAFLDLNKIFYGVILRVVDADNRFAALNDTSNDLLGTTTLMNKLWSAFVPTAKKASESWRDLTDATKHFFELDVAYELELIAAKEKEAKEKIEALAEAEKQAVKDYRNSVEMQVAVADEIFERRMIETYNAVNSKVWEWINLQKQAAEIAAEQMEKLKQDYFNVFTKESDEFQTELENFAKNVALNLDGINANFDAAKNYIQQFADRWGITWDEAERLIFDAVEDIKTKFGDLRSALSQPITQTIKMRVETPEEAQRWIEGLTGRIGGESGVPQPLPSWKEMMRKMEGLQHGGIVTHPTFALLGEKGPEAVIPLKNASLTPQIIFNAPLVQVDGAVDRKTADYVTEKIKRALKNVIVEASSSSAPNAHKRVRLGSIL